MLPLPIFLFLLLVDAQVEIKGNLTIGGLFSVHVYDDNNYNECSKTMKTDVYALLSEAQLFSIRYVNRAILAELGISVGTLILDSCRSVSVGLQQSVRFVQSEQRGLCTFPTGLLNSPDILLMANCVTSDTAKNVNYLLQAFCTPSMASSASSTEFDHPAMYPYFLRTVPSDWNQALVLSTLLLERSWTHVLVIHETSSYGKYLFSAFQRQSAGICIENDFEIDEKTVSTHEWDAVLSALNATFAPKVIVLLTDYPLALRFFEMMADHPEFYPWLQFVGVDGWSTMFSFEENPNFQVVMNNSIAIEPGEAKLAEFEAHLLSLNFSRAQIENPWIAEIISSQNGGCGKNCDPNLTLKTPLPTGIEPRARFVFQGIVIIAKALQALHWEFCSGKPGFCTALAGHLNGTILYEYMRNVSYTELPEISDSFEFVNNSGPPRYQIYQYKAFADKNPVWTNIGNYTETTELTLFKEKITKPESWIVISEDIKSCFKSCPGKQRYKYREEGTRCCIRCGTCSDPFDIVVSSNSSQERCECCGNGTIPNKATFSSCVKSSDGLFATPQSPSLVILGLCGLGSLLSVASFFFMRKQRRTPMMQAAVPDLSLMLAVSLALLFASPVLLVPTSSSVICATAWTISTVLLCLIHGITFAKAFRISNPKVHQKKWNRLNASQFILISLFSAQFLISLIWSLLRPPTIHHVKVVSPPEYRYLCSATYERQTLVLLIFPLSILLATFYVLRNALRTPYTYQLWQAKLSLAGCFALILNYAVLLLLFYGVVDWDDVNVRSELLMTVVLLTGYAVFATMTAPILYWLIFGRNTKDEVTRKKIKSHRFSEGNVMYFVDAEVLPHPEPRNYNDQVLSNENMEVYRL